MRYVYHDGGRKAAGFKALTGDCVCRSIVIASGLPYMEVYSRLAEGNATQRKGKHDKTRGRRTAGNGIHTSRKWFKDYMAELGFVWTPTMGIGTGCTVHLEDGELPMGRLVVAVSKHYTAVIDGVIRDTFDPRRERGRCVYGYWSLR